MQKGSTFFAETRQKEIPNRSNRKVEEKSIIVRYCFYQEKYVNLL